MSDQENLADYLFGSVHILRRSLELYDRGEIMFYRVMAVELRLLLCDTTRRHDQIIDLSLAPRLFPDLALPGLGLNGHFNGPLLPLSQWLAQEITLTQEKPVSLRNLVRRISDQDGGVHVDHRIHTRLLKSTSSAEWMRKIAQVVVEKLDERV